MDHCYKYYHELGGFFFNCCIKNGGALKVQELSFIHLAAMAEMYNLYEMPLMFVCLLLFPYMHKYA